MVVLEESPFIRAKVVVRAKWFYSGKSGCVPAKLVVFGREKVVVFIGRGK